MIKRSNEERALIAEAERIFPTQTRCLTFDPDLSLRGPGDDFGSSVDTGLTAFVDTQDQLLTVDSTQIVKGDLARRQ